MARYTSAYGSFRSRLIEVEILRNSAAVKERQDPVRQRDEINALCRGAIVLLSSHLEAYIKELGETVITAIVTRTVDRNDIAGQFFYHISKNQIQEIKETADPERIAEKVFSFLLSDSEFWNRTGPFPNPIPIDQFNKGFSNPAYEKIEKYFKRFGYSSYRTDLARTLRANYNVTITMVDHLVSTRNKIAHGDPTATKTPSDVKDMVNLIIEYSRTTDSLFGNWCKTNLCSIR